MVNWQSAFGLLKLVIIIVILMLISGVNTYVSVQDNGPIDRLEQEYLKNNIKNEVIAE